MLEELMMSPDTKVDGEGETVFRDSGRDAVLSDDDEPMIQLKEKTDVVPAVPKKGKALKPPQLTKKQKVQALLGDLTKD